MTGIAHEPLPLGLQPTPTAGQAIPNPNDQRSLLFDENAGAFAVREAFLFDWDAVTHESQRSGLVSIDTNPSFGTSFQLDEQGPQISCDQFDEQGQDFPADEPCQDLSGEGEQLSLIHI